jgi:hypothetical protein
MYIITIMNKISIIAIMLIIVIIFFYVCSPSKRSRTETAPQDTAGDSNEGEAPDDDSQQTTPGSALQKKSAHGLELLSNHDGGVSMRSLELNKTVPTKTRDPDAQKLYEANLTVSKTYTLFSFVLFGKHKKTEKHRDEAARWQIFYSAALRHLTV